MISQESKICAKIAKMIGSAESRFLIMITFEIENFSNSTHKQAEIFS